MKKPVAIVLIFVFLFNVIGYYGIYVGLTHHANKKVSLAIETSSYNPSETITIKIPLTIPYPIQNGIESLAGDFEYKGEYYKLVQQTYEKDTVYVVCLRNIDQKKAAKVLSDLVKQSTDQSSAPNQNTKSVIGFLKDYNPSIEQINLLPRAVIGINQFFESTHSKIIDQKYPVPTPPPDFIC